MPGKRNDITGGTYGRWTVLAYSHSRAGHTYYVCQCNCESKTTAVVTRNSLVSGKSISCGCYQREKASALRHDITGNTYGRWTVLQYIPTIGNGQSNYMCRCACGKIAVVTQLSLSRGKSTSCGCYHKERVTKHGESKTKLYSVWRSMKDRCYRKKHKAFHRYGGRGITVCDEWRRDFLPFKQWALDNGYATGLTIERVDNDLGYSPENCCWATRKEQANNTHHRNQWSPKL